MKPAFAQFDSILPLAQRDAWESLGNRFSGRHAEFQLSDLWGLLGVLLAGAALVGLLNWIYRRQQARRASNEPKHLFADMCRAHRLGRRDRHRLRMLAEAVDIGAPAVLFVRPDLFEAENLPSEDEKEIAAYQALADKLFAGLEALEPTQAAIEPTKPPVSAEAKPSSTVPVVSVTTSSASAPMQSSK